MAQHVTASLVLKGRTKASIQQKWDSLLQKYRDIKDKVARTGEEAVQNDWEFFNDMNEYLKEDPSITAPVTCDSIYGIKRKVEKIENQDDEVNNSLFDQKGLLFIYLLTYNYIE